jgi:hypothetical protein
MHGMIHVGSPVSCHACWSVVNVIGVREALSKQLASPYYSIHQKNMRKSLW